MAPKRPGESPDRSHEHDPDTAPTPHAPPRRRLPLSELVRPYRTLETALLVSTACLLAAVAWPIARDGLGAADSDPAPSTTSVSAPDPTPPAANSSPTEGPTIQIALLLDTSSSMSGLLDQARSHLWRVVNALDSATYHGATPRLEIAILDRLGHLVENVLAYAKIESNRTPLHVETVRVRDLMARMEARLHDRAQADALELDLRIEPPAGDIELETNPTAIEQILFNLVDNAAKYAAGSGDPRLDVVVTATQREVRFVVRDRGPGIPPEDRTRVFEPFTKCKTDEAGTRPGAGLGLALCREQARHLHGTLVLRDDGPGAAFELSVPRGEPRARTSK